MHGTWSEGGREFLMGIQDEQEQRLRRRVRGRIYSLLRIRILSSRKVAVLPVGFANVTSSSFRVIKILCVPEKCVDSNLTFSSESYANIFDNQPCVLFLVLSCASI